MEAKKDKYRAAGGRMAIAGNREQGEMGKSWSGDVNFQLCKMSEFGGSGV